MELSEDKTGEILTVALKGRLDASTHSSVEKRILELIQGGERNLVLDLRELEYISSIGLRVLMVVAKRLKSVKGEIAVCCASESIRQVFDISGFVNIFRMLETREEAIRELSAGLAPSSGGSSGTPEQPA
jgi:anti-anti-sigma factor